MVSAASQLIGRFGEQNPPPPNDHRQRAKQEERDSAALANGPPEATEAWFLSRSPSGAPGGHAGSASLGRPRPSGSRESIRRALELGASRAFKGEFEWGPGVGPARPQSNSNRLPGTLLWLRFGRAAHFFSHFGLAQPRNQFDEIPAHSRQRHYSKSARAKQPAARHASFRYSK